MRPWVGRDAHEPQQAGPGQTDPRFMAELFVEPLFCALMLCGAPDIGVEQQVRIDQDHVRPSFFRSSSSSSCLIRAFNSSGLLKSGLPRFMTFIWYGSRFFGGASISFSPRRSASLTTSFRLASRSLRRRSSRTALSSSKVSVVLIHQSIIYLML